MKRTLIIGASGQIGKQLTQMLLDGSNVVTAMVRDRKKLADLSGDTIKIVEADLTKDFGHVFEDCSQVIFVAGSGGDTSTEKTVTIDLWGARKAIDYAKQYHVEHFLMVSSIGADAPSEGPANMQPYLVAKHIADEHLMRSGLRYTILRPGSLTNDQAKGKFSSSRPTESDDAVITRADVASAFACLANSNIDKNRTIELFNGDESLTSALT